MCVQHFYLPFEHLCQLRKEQNRKQCERRPVTRWLLVAISLPSTTILSDEISSECDKNKNSCFSHVRCEISIWDFPHSIAVASQIDDGYFVHASVVNCWTNIFWARCVPTMDEWIFRRNCHYVDFTLHLLVVVNLENSAVIVVHTIHCIH